MEGSKEKVDFLSKFICTVYKWVYAISIIIAMYFIVIILNKTVEIGQLTMMFMTVILVASVGIAYGVSFAIKKAKNKLEIKKISLRYKVIFAVVSLVIALVTLISTTLIMEVKTVIINL